MEGRRRCGLPCGAPGTDRRRRRRHACTSCPCLRLTAGSLKPALRGCPHMFTWMGVGPFPGPAGTLRVYTAKQQAFGAEAPLVQGVRERVVLQTVDGLYVNIANIDELKQQGRLPEGWGWDAQVTVTGRT